MQTLEAVSFAQLQRDGARKLKGAGIDTATLDARILLCHAASISHETLVGHSDVVADVKIIRAFGALVARRMTGEPVARILGEKEFWSLIFELGPDTLVPRPDSECIVSAALRAVAHKTAPLRILDLGTGTGCLLLALLSELPNATGIGVDISRGAVDVARGNARALGLAGHAEFREGNWGAGLTESFDLIISNPPYIPCKEIQSLDLEVKAHDPARALDGGADGLDCYRQILEHLPDLLGAEGVAVFETSPDLYAELVELVAGYVGSTGPEGIRDLAGRWRGLRFGKGYLRP